MRLARIRVGGTVGLARLEGGDAVVLHTESSHPAADALREALALGVDLEGDGPRVLGGDFELLAPVVNPSKFLGVGLNYRSHALESGMDVPERPTLFVKTTNAIIGPDEDIVIRRGATASVDFEVEVVVVIGARVSGGSAEEAGDAVFGYTVGNDVTARDAQFGDGQWVRSKSFDTFAPLGPVIVTAEEVDPTALRLTSSVNGKPMQDGLSDDMIFSVPEVVSFVSSCITLEPGDLITTGTPPGVGFARVPPVYLGEGDTVTVEVDKIGSLTNSVKVRREEHR